LAKVTGAKLVPVVIEGTHEAWASTMKSPKRHPIRVRFGKRLRPKIWKEGLVMGSQNCYDAICVAARKALLSLRKKVKINKTCTVLAGSDNNFYGKKYISRGKIVTEAIPARVSNIS